jgi:hypothetical protein
MELTIENIIKIAIGVFVIAAVVLGIYLAMNSYVIPFFKGLGFSAGYIFIKLNLEQKL